jgi:hypothetical protein
VTQASTLNHADRQHAKYSSSRIHRVLACPGYVKLAARIPRAASLAAEEGTEAHEKLALSLYGLLGKEDCTADEWRGIEMVHDYLETLYISHPGVLVMQVEEPVVFPQAAVPRDEAAGIADILVLDPVEQEAWSIDFKFGHTYVSERRNPQLLFNAVAAWWGTPIKTLHLVIIQPHTHGGEPVRQDTVTGLEMAEFQARVEAAIAAAEEPRPALSPGPHCRFCEAELACPARERHALTVLDDYAVTIEQVENTPLPQVESIDPARLAYILRHADALRTWLSAAERHAYALAMSGQQVPDHKLVQVNGRREFSNVNAEIVANQLSGLTKHVVPAEKFLRQELIGVLAAEKLLVEHANATSEQGAKRKAVRDIKERMAFLTPRSSSGNLTLVSVTDPRPAADRVSSGFAGLVLPDTSTSSTTST